MRRYLISKCFDYQRQNEEEDDRDEDEEEDEEDEEEVNRKVRPRF